MNHYRKSMDALRFTPEQKRDMVEELLSAGTARRRKTIPMRRILSVAAAAALVAAMGVGAGASGVLRSAGDVFAGVFGGTPAQTEIIDRIGYPIGASASADGITITADAIVGDTYSYAIIYTVARDDGKPLAEHLEPNENGLLPLSFSQGGASIWHLGGMHGGTYFFDADPSDNAVQYVEQMSADSPLKAGTARATFRDLNVWTTGDDMDQKTTLAAGPWRLKFDFAFEDATVSLPAGQTFTLNGMEATVDAVLLSPLSFHVTYTVQEELEWSASRDESEETGQMNAHDKEQIRLYFDSLPLSLQMKDGSTLELSNAGGSIDPQEGKTVCQKSDVFSSILDLSQVESMTVGDVTIPVDVE